MKYARIANHSHPRAYANGTMLEHLAVVDRARNGRSLPNRAVVHHINGDGHDNRPQNLVVCQDQGYHLLLHVRAAAREKTGNVDMRKCRICGEYARPESMRRMLNRWGYPQYEHGECKRQISAEARARRAAARKDGSSPYCRNLEILAAIRAQARLRKLTTPV